MISFLSILAVGFFLGMRHATDPDHVVAVTTIVSNQRNSLRASLIGAFWGVGHTVTIFIEDSHSHFSRCQTLVRGFAHPIQCLLQISGHTEAFGIQDGEIVLALRIALLCRETQPFRGLRVVRGHSSALEIHLRQIAFTGRVVLIGGLAKPFDSLRIVFANAVASEVCQARLNLPALMPPTRLSKLAWNRSLDSPDRPPSRSARMGRACPYARRTHAGRW